jgi:hypothetical protein
MNVHLIGYVGPGPGLTMFWAFLALLGTIALAILYLLIWPFRMLIRKIRGTPPVENASHPPSSEANKSADAAPGPR